MKHKRLAILVPVLVAAPLLSTNASALDGPEETVRVLDNVVAVIDGEPITSSELQEFKASHGQSVDEAASGAGAPTDKKMLQDLLLSRMLEREARELGVAVADMQIDTYIDQIQAQNNVDREGLVELLKGQGLTLEQYREQVRGDILRARVLSMRVTNKINIVDEDVDRFLEEHPDRIPDSSGLFIQQLSFMYDPDDDDEKAAAEKKAQSAAEKLDKGEDPRQFGPDKYVDLGLVNPSDLRSDFREAVENLDDDDKTALIESAEGFYVLLVKGGVKEGELSEAFKDQIKFELKEKRFREATEKYILEALPEKYHVEMKL
ncbi:MAG: SurA N-terminal domain-containing protein [Bdellovibrionales bacterium]|nr:SurA N-terminal domain-containing protein [Bdellovibrionales bacterium]